MLRITRIGDGGSDPTLKLEGKLQGPWVDEARAACDALPARPDGLRLDLSALTFVDAPGARLLHELVGRGAVIAACTAFVAELLHVEKP